MSEIRYQHDCKICVFLGNYRDHDLYYCPQGGLPTVIARYSDAGPDYVSGRAIANLHPALAVAERLACDRGLLKDA